MHTPWTPVADDVVFPTSEIHVWRARLSPLPMDFVELAASLSADERHRAERFRFPQHCDRFVARDRKSVV